MKKLFILFVLIAVLLCSAACGRETASGDNMQNAAGTPAATATTTGTRPPEGPAMFPPIAEDSGLSLSDYEGRWVCGRCMLSVVPGEEGHEANILWSENDTEISEWNYYNCYFNGRSLVCPRTGEKIVTAFGDGGDVVSSETVQTGLYARFTIQDNGSLTWEDSIEGGEVIMEFERAD